MSTTTTTQTISLLADYEVHHSGSDAVNERETPPQSVEWPTHHRRIPAYRPTNRNLSFEERPGGSNPGEMVFIQVMLHGVWLNASLGFGDSPAAESMTRYFIMMLEESGRLFQGCRRGNHDTKKDLVNQLSECFARLSFKM
ncbi:hypothetical protein MYU51_004967 [Penicillium brevicompactum]